MRYTAKLALVLWVGICSCDDVMAGTIFNISSPSVPSVAPAVASAAQVSTADNKPAQSVLPAMPAPAATQSDRRSDESADAYQIRMNAVSQQALADLARAYREQNEKIRALEPK